MSNNIHECLSHLDNKQLVDLLLELPNRILHHEDLEPLAQIILHEVCHKDRLGLKRATYLVDNPDFGCMRGVAGYCKDECKYHKQDLWTDPRSFYKDMEPAEFHNKMRCFEHDSVCIKDNMSECKELHNLGKEIGIYEPNVYTWDMRNGNRGVFIFEEDDEDKCSNACKKNPVMLDKIASLLGLCRLH